MTRGGKIENQPAAQLLVMTATLMTAMGSCGRIELSTTGTGRADLELMLGPGLPGNRGQVAWTSRFRSESGELLARGY